MNLAQSLPLAVAACLIEAAAGYPAPLYRAIGHPVTWMGAWLAWLEARLNRPAFASTLRRAAGVLALALYLLPVAALSWGVTTIAPASFAGFAALALIAASLPAQRSLDAHVRDVAEALERGGLPAGRKAVARIVGRNVEALDEAGVARAALESLAENFSDGIVAPLFWIALGGLTGGALYKAINTADSLIGHKNERYLAFGWAAARLDDLVNLPASRLAALWLVIAACLAPGARPTQAWRAIWRDARHHRSPNAGWPEAAMAGALGLRLAGPRVYGETLVEDAFMGDGRREAGAADIRRGLALYRLACVAQALALGALAIIARG
jgi:adenosylcobinamide-phosphate synthase